MVPRAHTQLQSAAVPELPDLAILADALHAGLGGRRFEAGETPQSLVLRGTPHELKGLQGQVLVAVRRRGKFLTFDLERDRIMINPMLTGRLGLALPGARRFPQTAAVMTFAPRAGDVDDALPAAGAPPVAEWLQGASWLPGHGERVELRYRDSTRMGKIYLLPAGVARQVAGWDELGPDADDPAFTLDEWRTRIRNHSGELKNLLRNQAFVAGIGNAYSDEILWAARLAPFRSRSSLADEEVDALFDATRSVLAWAIGELRVLVPPRLEVEQRKFLRVHRKGGTDCPRCGAKLSEVSAGGFVTTWCRGCQR
jgi:formamidopyrimidine-DNA glycosylase